jgi:hypothetical protein
MRTVPLSLDWRLDHKRALHMVQSGANWQCRHVLVLPDKFVGHVKSLPVWRAETPCSRGSGIVANALKWQREIEVTRGRVLGISQIP